MELAAEGEKDRGYKVLLLLQISGPNLSSIIGLQAIFGLSLWVAKLSSWYNMGPSRDPRDCNGVCFLLFECVINCALMCG